MGKGLSDIIEVKFLGKRPANAPLKAEPDVAGSGEAIGLYTVVVGKPPASTTEITQPCDALTIFKAGKTFNKSQRDNLFKDDPNLVKLKTAFKQKSK